MRRIENWNKFGHGFKPDIPIWPNPQIKADSFSWICLLFTHTVLFNLLPTIKCYANICLLFLCMCQYDRLVSPKLDTFDQFPNNSQRTDTFPLLIGEHLSKCKLGAVRDWSKRSRWNNLHLFLVISDLALSRQLFCARFICKFET